MLLGLPVSDTGKLLGIPSQTINAWRNNGLLPDVGQDGEGKTGARFYFLDDMLVLAIMRDLTAGPAGIKGTLAAVVAKWSRYVFLDELAGVAPPGRLLALEAGADRYRMEAVLPEHLADRVASWRYLNRRTGHARLELIDVRDVALRVCAKLSWFDGARFKGVTEEEVRDLVEPIFLERASSYLHAQIAAYTKTRNPPDQAK